MGVKPESARTWLQTIAALASVILAIVALVVGLRAEKRSSDRFQAQLEQSERIAKANVRPLLSVYTLKYEDRKGILLANHGVGTAVVTSMNISKAEKEVTNIAKLFQFPSAIAWDDFYRFGETTALRAGDEIQLALLTAEGLMSQGYSREEAMRLLKDFETQNLGIEIRIEYEDVLGNKQKTYKTFLGGGRGPAMAG
jgi:hypothetical protein